MTSSLLETRALAIAIGARRLIDSLDLRLEPGMFVAVLGRNGTGKTLLLHTLAGLRPPQRGSIALQGEPLAQLPRRQIARGVALLSQDSEAGQHATVAETVRLGRYAHHALWAAASAQDHAAVEAAMQATDVAALAQRDTATLSGGELRRTAMAVVLAQQAPVMLLDEPTNHLDPQHCVLVLDAFARRVDAGAAVVATLHDPSLAARYATHALLLHGDGRLQFGRSAAVLGAAQLSELYATPMLELSDGTRRVFVPG